MSALSDKIIAMSKPYLGPATESFLARQCKAHLNIDVANVGKEHLKDLANWVNISGELVMDPAKAKELAGKIAVA